MKNLSKYIFGAVIFLCLFYFFFLSAPSNFISPSTVRIDSGMSLRSISSLLKKEHIIRSMLAFESMVILTGGDKHIISAEYLFENKMNVWQVVMLMKSSEHRIPGVVITIPEGFDNKQIGDLLFTKLISFKESEFLLEAKSKQGYLFPDTYFFSTNSTVKNILDTMGDNFNKKIASILPEINSQNNSFAKTEKDIITMASIIEREAKGDNDRAIISGILWNRIKVNMPLQVDAAPETYKTKGLPENPISNPGILAIEAAIHPQISQYIYYLHDKNGNIHYAKTFTEHQANIKKYLIKK